VSTRETIAGTVLTPGGWVEGDVQIDGTLIASVSGHPVADPAALKAPYVVPGFIDLHVHGGGGEDWRGGEEGVRHFVRYHTAFGTTAMAPTTAMGRVATIERSLDAITAIAPHRRAGEAIVLGAHLEGPFINPMKPGAMDAALALEGDPALAKTWAERFNIVIATVAPEIPGGLDVFRALSATGCRVQIGHSLATPAIAEQAFRCGCCGFTHLFNAMSQMDHRAPGVAAYALAKGEYAEIVSDLIHVDPTVILAAYRAIPKLYAITDASAAGMPDGNYLWGGHRVVKNKMRITLEDEVTLAGSAITMLDAFRNLVKIGLSLREASDMTAARQADYLGRSDLGRIETGARACLVRLDEFLAVEGIWVDGESVAPSALAMEGIR
jgi:N-acetylglucosamine-6-phosphate deacetylase